MIGEGSLGRFPWISNRGEREEGPGPPGMKESVSMKLNDLGKEAREEWASEPTELGALSLESGRQGP